MATSDEDTNPGKQTTLELIFGELAEMKTLCQRAADNSFNTNEIVKGLVVRVQTLENHRATDRATWYWTPMLISAIALAETLWLAYKFGGRG
jgi:hypothetical protein